MMLTKTLPFTMNTSKHSMISVEINSQIVEVIVMINLKPSRRLLRMLEILFWKMVSNAGLIHQDVNKLSTKKLSQPLLKLITKHFIMLSNLVTLILLN